MFQYMAESHVNSGREVCYKGFIMLVRLIYKGSSHRGLRSTVMRKKSHYGYARKLLLIDNDNYIEKNSWPRCICLKVAFLTFYLRE
jgi:hypothetical protein